MVPCPLLTGGVAKSAELSTRRTQWLYVALGDSRTASCCTMGPPKLRLTRTRRCAHSQRKSMYAGAAARAEFGFCQHAASRALALLELERQGGQQPYAVSGLTTTCSNSTWMAFEEWEQWEQCGAGLRVGAAAAGDAAAHAAGEQAKGDASASTLPLCFSQREHEYTLDGTWVAHSSPTPSSDYWERCPAMMARGKFQVPNQKYLCRGTYEKSSAHPHMRQQAQTGGRALDQDFVPNGCSLPAFDAGGFLRATGKNQTLWFVGDSMSHQMFISTACLVAQMDDIQDVEMPPNVKWFVDEDGCKATNFKTQCILVGLGVRICYVCRFRVDAAETLHEMMTTMGSSDSNTIVFNFGVRAPPRLLGLSCCARPQRSRSQLGLRGCRGGVDLGRSCTTLSAKTRISWQLCSTSS